MSDCASCVQLRRIVDDLVRERDDALQKLADRKVIERAKGVLMEQQLTEDAAYRLMRRAAMRHEARLADIARAVLAAPEHERSALVRWLSPPAA